MKKNQKSESKKITGIGVRPLGDRVLIKPLSADEAAGIAGGAGGGKKSLRALLFPTQSARKKPEQGRVVAVGEGRIGDDGKLIAPRVKVGDKVLFSKYGYDEVKIEDRGIF